jgi:hypothetical protein
MALMCQERRLCCQCIQPEQACGITSMLRLWRFEEQYFRSRLHVRGITLSLGEARIGEIAISY